jgi:hypothetical protein
MKKKNKNILYSKLSIKQQFVNMYEKISLKICFTGLINICDFEKESKIESHFV